MLGSAGFLHEIEEILLRLGGHALDQVDLISVSLSVVASNRLNRPPLTRRLTTKTRATVGSEPIAARGS